MQGRKKFSLFVNRKQQVYPVRKLVDSSQLETLLKQIESNENITEVDFSFSNLGNEGAIVLAKALRFNTKVTTVNLSDAQLSDEGLAALLVMMKTNQTILSLDVSRNMFKRASLPDALAISLDLNQKIQQHAEDKRVKRQGP